MSRISWGGSGLGGLNGQKFDVVILSCVLEHILDLREAIKECSEILNENGLLMIVVPNIESYHSHSDLYQEFSIEHINYFDCQSLSVLMQGMGYQFVDSQVHERNLMGLCWNICTLWRKGSTQDKQTNYHSADYELAQYLEDCERLTNSVNEKAVFLPSDNLYLWGCGTITAMLFQLRVLGEGQICGIFDSNQNYWGLEAYGTEIMPPDKLRTLPEYPVVIASQYAGDAIEETIRKLGAQNKVIRLF